MMPIAKCSKFLALFAPLMVLSVFTVACGNSGSPGIAAPGNAAIDSQNSNTALTGTESETYSTSRLAPVEPAAVVPEGGVTVTAQRHNPVGQTGAQAGGPNSGSETEDLKIPAGATLTVLERKVDFNGDHSNGNQMVRVGIDSDDLSLPSDVWMKASDLGQLPSIDDLQRSSDQTISGPDDANDSSIDNAIDGDIQQLIENASRHGGTPSCYRDVKHWLLDHGLVKSYPGGGAAYMGYNILKKQYGFTPVAFSQSLPIGAVCVSEGGRFQCGSKKCGHIAVKKGDHQWYGAGTFASPLLRGHYHMRCLVKR